MPSAIRHGLIAPILESLEYCFATILLRTDDLLFALAGSTGDGAHVNLHLDTLRFLRNLSSPWPHRLSEALCERWSKEPSRLPEDRCGLDAASWQGIETFASHAEALHLALIDSVQQRLLSAEREGMQHIPPPHGLAPAQLACALGRSLASYGAPPVINALIVRMLDQLLVPALGDFYQEVDDLLTSHGLESQRSESVITDPYATGVLDCPALLDHLDRVQAQALAQPDSLETLWSQGLPKPPEGCTLPPDLKRPMELMGALVYDTLSRASLPAADRSILAHLYIPLLKAALSDGQVITDLQHPARQLWQELRAQLAAANDFERERIAAIVQNLARRPGSEPHDFQSGLEALRTPPPAAPEPPTTPAGRQADSQVVQARSEPAPDTSFAAARAAATESIRQALAGRRLPDAARSFLLRTWGPFLINLAQAEGVHSAEFDQACTLMHTLARQAVLPLGGTPAIHETLASMQAFLATRPRPPLEGARAIDALRDAIHSLARVQPLASAPSTTPACVEAAAAPPIPAEALETFLRHTLQPGDWFLVHLGEEQAARRLKIYHVDAQQGIVVLADRMDRPVLDRPLRDLVEDMLALRTRPVFDDERHTYALQQLRQEIQTEGHSHAHASS